MKPKTIYLMKGMSEFPAVRVGNPKRDDREW